jgi:ribosomal protein L15E
MDAWLSLAGLAIAATDAGLLVLAWRQRAAISVVAGLAETRGGAGRSGIYRGEEGQILLGAAVAPGGARNRPVRARSARPAAT